MGFDIVRCDLYGNKNDANLKLQNGHQEQFEEESHGEGPVLMNIVPGQIPKDVVMIGLEGISRDIEGLKENLVRLGGNEEGNFFFRGA